MGNNKINVFKRKLDFCIICFRWTESFSLLSDFLSHLSLSDAEIFQNKTFVELVQYLNDLLPIFESHSSAEQDTKPKIN